ncbi:MAG: glutaminyl-peptide cyclotransferase [Anaerolineae bacterium]|jgi:glutamine cyclotransferase|nr:glutaminyl-peptide cyclotransferase [Anaerolineae bacterium]
MRIDAAMPYAWLVRRCGHVAFFTAVLLLVVATGVWSAAAGYPAFPDGDAGGAAKRSAPVPVYSYRVVATHPHDPSAFTQGLVYADEVFYEGTGLYGRSSLRRVDPPTGQVQQQVDLPPAYFGEGVALVGDTLYQLTWQEHTVFTYERHSFAATGHFTYTTEGWGLTYDGQRLIMSDGSNTLYFRDPVTFEETGRVQVFDGATPVTLLNELEFIGGEVYANVWQTDRIARIEPQTGRVTAWIDLTGLRPPQTDVLNGIAYDAGQDRLFVTGKLWPYLYEIALVPRPTAFMPLVWKS